MRFIVKQGAPADLQDWMRDNRHVPQNLTYGNLPTNVKDAVKLALLMEQGYLCAYTLRKLQGIQDCHIEHVEPQSTTPDKDLTYTNMAACAPKDGGDTSSGYGASIKAGQEVKLNENFVSPYLQGCSERFQFDAKGCVHAAVGDVAVKQTIAILKLNHAALVDLRRSALQAHGLNGGVRTTRTARKLKSASEARRFAVEVLKTDSRGQLEPYCLALAQVALVYAEKEEARAKRLR